MSSISPFLRPSGKDDMSAASSLQVIFYFIYVIVVFKDGKNSPSMSCSIQIWSTLSWWIALSPDSRTLQHLLVWLHPTTFKSSPQPNKKQFDAMDFIIYLQVIIKMCLRLPLPRMSAAHTEKQSAVMSLTLLILCMKMCAALHGSPN